MKQRIIFLLHLPPPVHGSSIVGKYIAESTTINKNIEASFINLLASNKVGDTGKISFYKFWGYIKTLCRLAGNLLFKQRPGLCYFALSTTGIAFIKDVLLVSVVKLFRVPIIFHLHNKGISEYSSKPLFDKLYRFVFKNSRVILLSELLYHDIKKYVCHDQVEICPNGITAHDIAQKERKTDKTRHKTNFLFLSNLIESKGIYVLLEACGYLKKQEHSFKLTIVGGEGDIPKCKLQEQIGLLNLKEDVTYLGKKYGKEKETIFNESDIFVFPTFYDKECFPLVLLEACMFGLPSISCNEGGITDIIKESENGFIVPQKDPKALADKMTIFIENPVLIKKMGIKGRKYFEDNFTLQVFEYRMREILIKGIRG